MICNNCNKNKSCFVITEILMGKESEVFLCESCALEKGFGDILFSKKINIKNFVVSFINQDPKLKKIYNENPVCSCNFSIHDFVEKGSLNCPNCFQTFEHFLRIFYQKLFGNFDYNGKIPDQYTDIIEMNKQLEALNRELKEVISVENYERAALIRDKINQIKTKHKGL